MATNLMTSDDTPFDATIRQELAENGGLPADSPVHAYSMRSDDPVEQVLRGIQEEADADEARAQSHRVQELIAAFQASEPDTPPEVIETSARRIAEREAPADYTQPVNPEYNPQAHGELRNPNATASWWDQLADSRVVGWLKGIDQAINPESVGRMVAGGATDMARATLGTLELVRETAANLGVKAGVREPDLGMGEKPPEGQPNIIGHTEAGRPIVRNEDGSVSTERTITVIHPGLNDGKPTNIPSMYGGIERGEDEAAEIVIAAGGKDPETGRELPGFDTMDDAVKAAEARTEDLGNTIPQAQGSIFKRAQAAIPQVETQGAVENLGRGLIQFASFFIPVMGSARALGYGGKLTAAAVSALESFANRNPDDQTLTTFVTQIAPGLENTPVLGAALEFLKSDPNDSEALRRFKFVLEDIAVGQLVDLGLDAKGTVQSLGNMFDTVRQAKGGKVAKDILTDESGAIWFGRPKEDDFLSGPIEPDPRAGAQGGIGGNATPTNAQAGSGAIAGETIPPPSRAAEAPTFTAPDVRPMPRPGARAETPPARPQEAPQRPPVPPQYQEVDDSLEGIARQYNEEYERFRRGDVRHIADVADEARNMGVRAEDFADLEPGSVLNDTHTAALGQVQLEQARRLLGLMDEYTAAKTPANEEALKRAIKDFGLVDVRAMGTGREAGRTLRILQEAEIGRSAMVRNLEKAIGAAQATGRMDVLVETFQKLQNPGKVAKLLNGIGSKAKVTQDTLAEIYINSLLSKPATFVRNMIGSTAFLGGLTAERVIAGVIDKPISLVFGRDGSGVSLGEARAMIHGQWLAKTKALHAIAHGFSESPQSYQLGQSAFAVPKSERPKAITAVNYGLDPDGAMGKLVNFAGRQVRLPGRVMAAGDAFNRVLAHDAQLHALAYRRAREAMTVARRNGARGTQLRDTFNRTYSDTISNPNFRLREEVEQFGNMATFTDQAGPLAQGLTDLVERLPLLRLILPFINTPARIISQSFQRVPGLGLMARENRDALLRGTRADREIVAAKQAVGMAVAGVVGYLALSGRITGEGSKNKTLRAAEYGSKIPPRSIGIGSDEFGNPTQWIPYNNVIEPYGSTLGFFADLAQSMPLVIDSYLKGNTEPMNAASEALGVMTTALMNFTSKKSYLVQMNNIIDAMSDDSGQKMQRILGALAAGFMPNIVRGLDSGEDIKEAKTAWERFKRSIPIWNDDLKVKRDPITGEPTRRVKYFNPQSADDPQEAALLLLLDISTPANPVTRGEDPETEWIYENILKDRLTGIGLEVSDTVHGVKLDDEQLDRLEVLRAGIKIENGMLSDSGKTLKESLLEVMQSEQYRNSEAGPDGGKEWHVRTIFRQYQNAAEYQLFKEFPELAAKIGMQKLENTIRRTPGILSPEGQVGADRVREEAARSMQQMLIAR